MCFHRVIHGRILVKGDVAEKRPLAELVHDVYKSFVRVEEKKAGLILFSKLVKRASKFTKGKGHPEHIYIYTYYIVNLSFGQNLQDTSKNFRQCINRAADRFAIEYERLDHS